jgi:hypothetical protein
MGRPRKPLWPPGHRGFESHTFRVGAPASWRIFMICWPGPSGGPQEPASRCTTRVPRSTCGGHRWRRPVSACTPGRATMSRPEQKVQVLSIGGSSQLAKHRAHLWIKELATRAPVIVQLYFGPTTEQRYTSPVSTRVISGLGPAAAARTCSSETNW